MERAGGDVEDDVAGGDVEEVGPDVYSSWVADSGMEEGTLGEGGTDNERTCYVVCSKNMLCAEDLCIGDVDGSTV